MARYRNRLEIIADMLSVVRDGAKKTHIMYQANLSFKLLRQYLAEVLDAGLVNVDNGNYYRITRRGQNFLDRFSEYSERRGQIEQQLNNVKDEKTVLENMVGGNYAGDRHSNERVRKKKDT